MKVGPHYRVEVPGSLNGGVDERSVILRPFSLFSSVRGKKVPRLDQVTRDRLYHRVSVYTDKDKVNFH